MQRRNDLVTENLRLVHSCCHRFSGKGIEYDDLYQVGCIGLIKAADRFDENLGFKFSTYAVPVIMGEIKRLFRDTGPIKVSRSLKELSMKVLAARSEFENKNNREPTLSEISEILQVPVEDVTEAVCACKTPDSLTAYSDDGTDMRENDLAVDDRMEEISGHIALKCAIEKLSEKDQKIIAMRYYSGKTQSQTAKILNMTQVQVSRREKKILSAVREMLV